MVTKVQLVAERLSLQSDVNFLTPLLISALHTGAFYFHESKEKSDLGISV